ncbi:MAG: hypothetical protein KDN18_12105, partial [Verrucomicrobiae bacterium]|nr:hypothetical protein [Verrucomicrobiae bacterium]
EAENVFEASECEFSVREVDQVWVALKSEEGSRLLRLGRKEWADDLRIKWDNLNDKEVLGVIRDKSSEGLAAREAAMEWQRRFRRDADDLAELFDGAVSGSKLTNVVSSLAGLERADIAEMLLELAKSPRPDVQAAAYEAFGDLPEATEHPALAALGEITLPGVTAALFEALVRSQSRLPGSEAVAAALVDHADADLAKAARAYLVQRQAVQAILAAWDEKKNEEARGIFSDLLSGLPDSRVPGGIFQKIESATLPVERAELASVLCAWYRQRKAEGENSGRLEEVMTTMHRMLEDRRNDRRALLQVMENAGVPFPPAEKLARYAMENPSLEVFALEAMIREERNQGEPHELPAKVENWLGQIKGSTDRDVDLRIRALCLLSLSKNGGDLRKWFAESASLIGQVNPGTRDLLFASWRDRAGLGASVDWFIEQSRDRNAEKQALALQVLFGILVHEDNETSVRERSGRAIADAWGGAGGTRELLQPAFEVLSNPEKRAVLSQLHASSDNSLRNCGVEIARWAGRDPETGEIADPIERISKKEIATGLESQLNSGNADHGRELLRTKGCTGCHNLNGEGWGFGPDLILAFADGTLRDFIDRLPLGGDHKTDSARLTRYETADGRSLEGWRLQRVGTAIELVDKAGNLVSVPSSVLRSEGVVAEANPPCEVGMIDLFDLSDLVFFLRTCSNF